MLGGVSSQEEARRLPDGWDSCRLHYPDLYAECDLQPNYHYFPARGLTGVARFSQFWDPRHCQYGSLNVDLFVEQFPMIDGRPTSEHGFHVLEYGDMSHSCYSMRGHFNPYRTHHGAPWMPFNRRHVGDFGNVIRRADGTIHASFSDPLADLSGPDSIIGRGLVITENRDDLGLGGHEYSWIDGNSGPPVACCVIRSA